MISIIVPVYNLEACLAHCLDAIAAQTCSDYELLLIDDGSTDGSADICRAYAARDSRIRLIQKPNGGVSSARNRGLDEARGEYVTFIDGDDICAPNLLERLMEGFEKDGTAVLSRCSYKKLSSYDEAWAEPPQEAEACPTDQYLGRILDGSAEVGVWGGIYICDLIGSLRFDPSIRHNEDKLFLFQYVLKAQGTVVFTSDKLYGYYTRPGSATQAGYSPRLLSVIDANTRILELVEAHRPELTHAAKLNLQVARLSVLKSIIESGNYRKEYETFRRVKRQVLDNWVRPAPPKRWLEQASLRLGDWVYRGFVTLYRSLCRYR